MKVVLIYLSKELGGAETLMIRLAEKFSEMKIDVTIIDSEKKIIHNRIKNKNIKKIVYSGEKIFIDNSYLLFFANYIYNPGKYVDFGSNIKVLFWSVHPLNLIFPPPFFKKSLFKPPFLWLKILYILFFPLVYFAQRGIVSLALKKKSLVFMDDENADFPENFFQLDIDRRYVSIPVSDEVTVDSGKVLKVDCLNVFWYGRLCDFKSFSLINIIEQLSALTTSSTIHIVGDGDMRDVIIRCCIDLGVDYVFYGNLENSAALQLIRDEADLVFAMGTAALESAKMQIPTLLVPISYQKIDEPMRLIWLFETTGYSLGGFWSDDALGKPLAAILAEYRSSPEFYASQCQIYVNQHHQIECSINQLLHFFSISEIECRNFISFKYFNSFHFLYINVVLYCLFFVFFMIQLFF